MDTEPALVLIRSFAAQGGAGIVITGGEPLLHPACQTLLKTAKEVGLNTTIFSMGVTRGLNVVTKGVLAQLQPHIDRWYVSLHSATPALHDSLTRVPGSFAATCSAVPAIIKAGIQVRATFFAHPKNLPDLNSVAALCEQLGVEELRVVTAVEQGRAASRPGQFAVPADEIDAAIADAGLVASTRVRLGESAAARKGALSLCAAIDEELVVNWDGWISPCHAVEPYPSDDDRDNVFRHPLDAVLETSPRLRRCRDYAVVESAAGCIGRCLAQDALVSNPSNEPHRRGTTAYPREMGGGERSGG